MTAIWVSLRLATCALITVVIASCGASHNKLPRSALLQHLQENRQLWLLHEPDSYSYTYSGGGFCCLADPSFRISHDDGTVVSTPIPDRYGHSRANQAPKTIADMFDHIERMIDRDVDGLEVVYDASYGYPREVHVDPYSNAIDDEASYFISEFVAGESELSRYYDNLFLWAGRGIHDYQYTHQRDCQCEFPGSLNVVVRSGNASEVYSATAMRALDYEEWLPLNLGFAQLFELIRESLDAGTPIQVDYDTTFGYPARIAINEALLPVDGGAVVTVSEFSYDASRGLDE